MLHLWQTGLLTNFRIVGTSLEDVPRDDFISMARKAVDEFSNRPLTQAQWDEFAATLHWASIGDGPDALRDKVLELEAEPGRRTAPAALPERAAGRRAVVHPAARQGRPRRAVAGHHGEALRHRPGQRGGAERGRARGLRRDPGVPHRPLPGQGGGAEHPRVPLRERAVRAHLAPQPHRPRADRRARDPGPRRPGRVLREHRRLPRHGGHPPVPGARVRGDGAADRAWSRGPSPRRRTRSSVR
nr:hypothetical protein [Angustibacter aerolatus]